MRTIVCHALLGLTLVIGCGKEADEGGGGAAEEDPNGVNSGGQPAGDDGSGDGAIPDLPPECLSDQKRAPDGVACVLRPITEMSSRSDCIKNAGFWYDVKDVLQTTAAGFDALKPTCHASHKDACPATGMLAYGKSFYGDSIDSDDVTDDYVGGALKAAYSTLRCFSHAELELGFSYGDLKEFDASLNPDLKRLYLDENPELKSLIFAKSVTKLEDLSLDGTKIPAETVEALTSFKYLSMFNMPEVKTLNVSKMKDLQFIYVGNTGLTALDLSKNDAIQGVDVSGTTIPIASLNLMRYPNLMMFGAAGRGLTSLAGIPVANLMGLALSGNSFPTIDFSASPGLWYLDCRACAATTVDLSQNPNLTYLYLEGNLLTEIDLSANPELSFALLNNNQLTEVVTNNPQLWQLDVSDNDLTYDGMTTKWDLHLLENLDSLSIRGNPNLVLNFEEGVTVHENLLDPTKYASIHVEQARWAAFTGPDKPAWVYSGIDPDGWYSAN